MKKQAILFGREREEASENEASGFSLSHPVPHQRVQLRERHRLPRLSAVRVVSSPEMLLL
jgi:hypothetical protein